MSTYDIYGVGNAIVDVEVEVNDEELKLLHFTKGAMTLIDEDTLS